jgi:hypothetical protein
MTKAKVVFAEDGKGNRFFKIGDWTRVTLVKAKNRDHAKNWAGCDVLRIQSYRNLESENVMMGAEFPLDSPEALDDLINALQELARGESGKK